MYYVQYRTATGTFPLLSSFFLYPFISKCSAMAHFYPLASLALHGMHVSVRIPDVSYMEFATPSAQVPTYLTSTDEYSVMDGKVLWPCSNSRAG